MENNEEVVLEFTLECMNFKLHFFGSSKKVENARQKVFIFKDKYLFESIKYKYMFFFRITNINNAQTNSQNNSSKPRICKNIVFIEIIIFIVHVENGHRKVAHIKEFLLKSVVGNKILQNVHWPFF